MNRRLFFIVSLLSIFCSSTLATQAQTPRYSFDNGFGVSLTGTTKTAFGIGAVYRLKRHGFRLGYIHQFNGQLGQKKDSQLANYGQTVVGNDTYFQVAEAGYDFWFHPRISVGIDGCAGYNSSFSNYSDKRFKAGGYHMITGSEEVTGYGGRLSYLLGSYFVVSGSYNTLTGPGLTLQIVGFGAKNE